MRQAAAFCMSCRGWIKVCWEPSQEGVVVQTSNDYNLDNRKRIEGGCGCIVCHFTPRFLVVWTEVGVVLSVKPRASTKGKNC